MNRFWVDTFYQEYNNKGPYKYFILIKDNDLANIFFTHEFRNTIAYLKANTHKRFSDKIMNLLSSCLEFWIPVTDVDINNYISIDLTLPLDITRKQYVDAQYPLNSYDIQCSCLWEENSQITDIEIYEKYHGPYEDTITEIISDDCFTTQICQFNRKLNNRFSHWHKKYSFPKLSFLIQNKLKDNTFLLRSYYEYENNLISSVKSTDLKTIRQGIFDYLIEKVEEIKNNHSSLQDIMRQKFDYSYVT